MKKVNSLALTLAVFGTAQALLAQSHTVTGTLDSAFYNQDPNPRAIQTINTGFGDNKSELDAGYGIIRNNNLYLFIAGNLEFNGNHLNIFIDDGAAGGQSTLNAVDNLNGGLVDMNGSKFSSDFTANYALDGNVGSAFFLDQYDLNTDSTKNAHNFSGSFAVSGGIGSNLNERGGLAIAVNNNNTGGVSGDTTKAADTAAAASVNLGLELAIPLVALGSPSGGNIKILVDVNGGGNGFLSNQFLPGLPAGSGNLGNGGKFDFSASTGMYFTVAVPATGANGTWVNTGSGSWKTDINWANNFIPGVAGDPAIFAATNNAATVTLDGNRTVGSIAFNNSGGYTIAAGTGGTLTLDNAGSDASIQDFHGSHTISANIVLNSNLNTDIAQQGDQLSFTGNISGPGQFAVNNLGSGSPTSQVVLSGNNTFTGGVLIRGGNLQLGSDTALPAGTSITFDAGDVPDPALDLKGHGVLLGSITTLTGPQTQNVGAKGLIINNGAAATVTYAGSNASVSTFMGSISDSGAGSPTSLHVVSGALTLQGNSTYNGATIIDNGATLNVVSTGAGLPMNNSVSNNGTLNVSASSIVSTIAGSGNVHVDFNLTILANTISQNSLTILSGGRVALFDGGSIALAGLNLEDNSPTTTAQLDLNNGSMTLSYMGSSPIATVRGLIAEAFDGGNWDPDGITSTAAHNDPNFTHGLGYAESSDLAKTPLIAIGGSIVVRYTQYGDNNLNGTVDATDFKFFIDGIANGGSSWFQGDYTYDGVVDLGNDFTLFLENYLADNNSLASLGAIVQESSLGAAQKASLLEVIPEPSSIALLAIGAGALATRRRRK